MFSHGHRNSFGFDFDPRCGNLWLEENGDDAFTELDLVQPGMNGGWIQAMGPIARIDQFKLIETTMFGGNLQQSRWPPTNIADSPEDAQVRMVMLPGAHYRAVYARGDVTKGANAGGARPRIHAHRTVRTRLGTRA